MPLSEPAEREALHARRYDFHGYRRRDGLWDIEGRIVDTKTYGFANYDRAYVEAGEPLHDMEVRLTVDDDLVIQHAEAVTNASPFTTCPAIAPNYQKLIGKRMGAGWRRAVKDAMGGTEGCTHISELLGAMATVAFQTIYPILAKEGKLKQPAGQRPGLINSCHAFRSDGPVVARAWPEHYEDQPTRATADAGGES
jgi:hypothetical protein